MRCPARPEQNKFDCTALRASGRLLRAATAAEYAALGFTAGLLGALAATVVAWILATRVFSLPWRPDWRVWVAGILAGTILVAVSGLLATRRVLNAPPVETLRET